MLWIPLIQQEHSSKRDLSLIMQLYIEVQIALINSAVLI